jgi:hypothetical protein
VLVGVVNNTKALEYIVGDQPDTDSEEEEKVNRERQAEALGELEILEQWQTDYEQLHESGMDVSLLSEAFRNIAANSTTGRLLSLSLEVVVYREDAEKRLSPLAGGGWRFIWECAADTFHIGFGSLTASNMPIERLNIFNDRRLQRCSLACNELGSVDFKQKGLAISLASMKLLSVSVSDRVVLQSKKIYWKIAWPPVEDIESIDSETSDDEARDIADMRAEAADECNFIGLANLLQLSSQLEDLKIHKYRLGMGVLNNRQADLHLERLLQLAAEIDTPPKLRRIELRGLYVREEDLLAFIWRTGIRKLFMYKVFMSSGSFRSVFDYCTSDAACMEELYFNELFEGHLNVYFDGPGRAQIPPLISADPGPGSDILERVGAEVKRHITYRSVLGGAAGSPTMVQYVRQRRIEYGPPQ